MEEIARLPVEAREEILAGIDPEQLLWDWNAWGRPEQRPPEDDSWAIWLYMAGRGGGKTRSAGEWIREKAKYTNRGRLRFALVARTAADTRDVMVEGESGLMNITPPSELPNYQPSIRRITWPNGNSATLFCASADTEILTRERGWVTHDDLQVGDVVLTFNERSGMSEWQPAQGVHRFEVADQDVARITGRFHDSVTTLEHRWPAWDRAGRVHWTTTKQIIDGTAGTKTRLIGAAPNADLPSVATHPDALVELVAWYMTEGTYPNDFETTALTLTDPIGWNKYLDKHRPLTRQAYRSGRRIRGQKTLRSFTDAAGLEFADALRFFSPVMSRPSIAIAQSRRVNPKHCANIERALVELFGAAREVGTPTAMTWLIGRDGYKVDPDAAVVILKHFSDRRYKVPSRDFILSLTRHQLELFIDRCIDGDGHRKNSSNISMGQNHSGRNEIFALALTLLGVPYSQFESKKEYKGEPYMWYATSARRSPGVPLVPRIVASARVESYTGVVWCPVTENKTWFARRNGKTYFTGNTADEPDTLRGPQFHYSWADEAAAWRQIPDATGLNAFDNLRIATRLGAHPQIAITTTPKRVPLMRSLLAEEATGRVVVTRGKTSDNASNLSEAYMDAIMGVYAGTRLARQELYGEMMEDVEGALWSQDLIDLHRTGSAVIGLPIKLVGVDPSVSERPKDECGIIVIGCTAERELWKRQAWVLEDTTVHGSPDVWSQAVVRTAQRWGAPVVAEVNQGGALVKSALAQHDASINVIEVHSKVGKALRAEPVVLAYEQGRVHHLGILAELEAQQTSWVPGETRDSPDRVDALVHALTAAMIKPPPGLGGGGLTARPTAARRKLPGLREARPGRAKVFRGR
jgi:phage terminase large subunit-like protein